MKGVLVAAAFLTRVRVPSFAGATDVGDAARWFPLVGAFIGGAGAAAAWAMRELLGLPPLLTATLIVGLAAWVTGAIHLDGLADTADGFGGGRTREDVLRIMRDPAIGSYGAVAVLLVLTTKVAALAALLERDIALPFLVAAPAISRWTIVPLSAWLPYARVGGGVGEAVTGRRDPIGALVATAVTAAIAVAALGRDTGIPWALAALVTMWVGATARRRIGGVTGDVFGAGVELTETTVLVSGVCLAGRA